MRARFDPGHRYRLRCKVPAMLDPRTVVRALQRDVSDVAISNVVRGILTVEATWRGAARVIDTEYLVSVERIDPESPKAA